MTRHDADRLARLALSRAVEGGDGRINRLVTELGAVPVRDYLLDESRSEFEPVRAVRITACDPVAELDRAAAQGIRFVTPADDEWPEGLDDLHRAENVEDGDSIRGGVPFGLWVAGTVRLDALGRQVAIVGSRSGTSYGGQLAGDIAATCARAGFTVVSGAAFGIDQAAHRGSLAAGGCTSAVLACGVDRVYPAAHKRLVDHIAATAAVISEQPPGASPMRVRFLTRNRLIAALSVGTVIVEAAHRSGALSTARWAGRLQRPLAGVPGPVTSAASGGVHELIRTGAATLVTNGAEVLEVVGQAGEHLLPVPRGPAQARDRLTHKHRMLLEAVPVSRPAGCDSVAHTAGLGLIEARTALWRLERLGLVSDTGTGWVLTELARS